MLLAGDVLGVFSTQNVFSGALYKEYRRHRHSIRCISFLAVAVYLIVNILGREEPEELDMDIHGRWNNDVYWMNNSAEWYGNFLQRPKRDRVVDFDKVTLACDRNTVNTSSCLRYLDTRRRDYETFGNWKEGPEIYHIYVDRAWDESPSLMIKSFLFTQPIHAQLWVWMKPTLIEEALCSPSSQKYLPHVEVVLDGAIPSEGQNKRIFFREFDWGKMVMSVPGFEIYKPQDYTVVAQSDIVRFALLSQYEGLYLDMDNLLLRDMSDLYHAPHDWAYEWSYHGCLNTAVLRMRTDSMAGKSITKEAPKWRYWSHPKWFHGDNPFHPYEILQYVAEGKGEIKMLPSVVFDPLWLKTEKIKSHMGELYPNFPSFWSLHKWIVVEEPRMMDFFRGAWSYHWHGGGLKGSEMRGWLKLWDSLFDCHLNGNCPNFYGEMMSGTQKK